MDFNYIKNYFDNSKWDVGLLTNNEIKQCCLQPINMQRSVEYGIAYNYHSRTLIESIPHVLVIIRKADLANEYAILYKESEELMTNIFGEKDIEWNGKVPNVKSLWFNIYLNSKSAALIANLGVKGKNSLVHTYKFGFNARIVTFGITTKIINYNRTPQTFKYLDACNSCNLCIDRCPVNAIHADGDFKYIDVFACDEHLSKTAKMNWKDVTNIEQYYYNSEPNNPNIPNDPELLESLPHWPGWGGKLKDGELIGFDMCTICQKQKPCSLS